MVGDAVGRGRAASTAGSGLVHFSEKRRVGASHEGLAFASVEAPLSVIVSLRRPDDGASPVPSGPLSGRDAVLALASEVFRLDPGDAAASRAHFEAVTALAQTVPVVAVPRRPPAAAVADVLCRMSAPDV